ncbi:MAG: orotate phosphoribosyltransferase, partial [Rhabdochlamydiaceae bacterium]
MAKLNRRDELLFDLGKSILKTGAFRIGNFTTPDGKTSPYFIDLGRIISFPDVMSLALECLDFEFSEINNENFDCFCGVPIPGLIFGALLAHRKNKPLVYPTRESNYRLKGILKPGSQVLVIDDVSETGQSIEHATQSVRANGGMASHALTLVDRSESALESLSRSGVKLHSFTTVEELVTKLKENLALP